MVVFGKEEKRVALCNTREKYAELKFAEAVGFWQWKLDRGEDFLDVLSARSVTPEQRDPRFFTPTINFLANGLACDCFFYESGIIMGMGKPKSF